MCANMEDSWEDLYMKNVQIHIEEHGVSGLEKFFKEELERWKDVESTSVSQGILVSGNQALLIP